VNTKWTPTLRQQTDKLEARHKHKKQIEACGAEIAHSINGNTRDHAESNNELTLKLKPMQMTKIMQKRPRAQHQQTL
jgi:hypothetical protein